jgi:hypothetical protein
VGALSYMALVRCSGCMSQGRSDGKVWKAATPSEANHEDHPMCLAARGWEGGGGRGFEEDSQGGGGGSGGPTCVKASLSWVRSATWAVAAARASDSSDTCASNAALAMALSCSS